METTATSEIIFRWIAGLGVAIVILFLLFGFLRGIYMERQQMIKKYGRRRLQH
jgi:UPF0716 family protein affecting phage T7 exclusion